MKCTVRAGKCTVRFTLSRGKEKSMIYLYQNDNEYDYDVRAISLAFFEREKIVSVTES